MRYAIERQYLLPTYQHVFVEARSVEEACQQACEDPLLDWEGAQQDFDNSGATYVTAIVEVPADAPADIRAAELIYPADRPGVVNSLPIPPAYAEAGE